MQVKTEFVKFRLSAVKKEKLKRLTEERGESMSYFIERAIDDAIEKLDTEKKEKK